MVIGNGSKVTVMVLSCSVDKGSGSSGSSGRCDVCVSAGHPGVCR